jgi:hypothetical protein
MSQGDREFNQGHRGAMEWVIQEIDDRITRERENMSEARRYGGVNSPGFNQPLGAQDALNYLREAILENWPEYGQDT